MRTFLEILAGFFAPLLWLLVPLLLIVVGGTLVGLGFHLTMPIIGWIGAALVAAGIVWGALLFFMNGPATW